MTLPNSQPQRELTPAEKKRSARLFWLILLLFAVMVGVMAAYLSVKGRQVRDYGQAVLHAAQSSQIQFTAAGLPCSRLELTRTPPSVVKTCQVSRDAGGLAVILTVEGERQYRVK